MAVNANVKITVLNCAVHPEVAELYAAGPVEPCARFRAGQVFTSRGANMPDGFCTWAWADIQKYALVVARGGNHDGRRPGRQLPLDPHQSGAHRRHRGHRRDRPGHLIPADQCRNILAAEESRLGVRVIADRKRNVRGRSNGARIIQVHPGAHQR